MQTDFEKLGVFYLGRKWDTAAKKPTGDLILYDSKDLCTHGVCIGMTGSGKTGLCLDLIEEAAIDAIPTIAIDIKGDITNIFSQSPDLTPQELQRVELLKQGTDFALYTPGSSAGRSVSVLKSFDAPPQAVLEDGDAFRERISSAATSVLVLLGIDADPLQSREHILLSNILKSLWTEGKSLTIFDLVSLIQKPPITRIGAIDVESIFPSKERFAFSMKLNNLLASPGFEAWMEGEPLEIDRILYGQNGKPRTSVFYVSHLSDNERMFFVTTLLTRLISWMCTQAGTPSLRAVLYMDEIFGFFPPVSNPPSKQPLLTLLKQARAYGVGVLLATQNPVDLDYKGLSNTGTWFIGRLQTERDKMRVLDGLEGAAASNGSAFDRRGMDQILSGLGERVFLLNNVHEDGPVLFQTRKALSHLTGPMTLEQIKQLKKTLATSATTSSPSHGTEPAATVAPPPSKNISPAVPLLPPDVKVCYLPVRSVAPAGANLVYVPRVLGVGNVKFSDTKSGVDSTMQYCVLATAGSGVEGLSWSNSQPAKVWTEDLVEKPEDGASYGEVPPEMNNAKSYAKWSKDFVAWLFASKSVKIFRSELTGEYSKPRENERDFRIRLAQSAREKRDEAKAELQAKYAPKIATLQEREARRQAELAKQQQDVQQQQINAALNVGATVLGAFMGRRGTSIGRATTAARSVGRTAKEQQDVQVASDNLQRVQQQLAELDAQFKQEMSAIEVQYDPANLQLSEVTVAPKKANITVPLIALAWAPFWKLTTGELKPAWIRTEG
jgi:hypothetical protein